MHGLAEEVKLKSNGAAHTNNEEIYKPQWHGRSMKDWSLMITMMKNKPVAYILITKEALLAIARGTVLICSICSQWWNKYLGVLKLENFT